MASYRGLKGDGVEMNSPTIGISPRAVRSPSVASDVFSQSARSGLTSTLPQANPPPAYIATAEASQLVSTEAEENVDVAQLALDLLNSFLDHILYTLLSSAQSTKLPRLREIIPIVLKPRLGKAALLAADEELKEYLDEADEDALQNETGRFDPKGDFDLDLAWKLARLRCMVYTRLGDMEEEDEEEYIELDQLHEGRNTHNRTAYRASTANAASAIFLTSILEFIGEQALLYAVQNTQRRCRVPESQKAPQLTSNGSVATPLRLSMVLDEADMFHVGRESPLSRLWRSWRRQTRSPMDSSSRALSRMSNSLPNGASPPRSRKNSIVMTPQSASVAEMIHPQTPREDSPPTSARDANETDVPSKAGEVSDENGTQSAIQVPLRSKRRPLSMVTDKTVVGSLAGSLETSPTSKDAIHVPAGRMRSSSHPGPERSQYKPYDPGNASPRDNGDLTKDYETETSPGDNSDVTDVQDAPNQNGSMVAKVASAMGLGALVTTVASHHYKHETSAQANTSAQAKISAKANISKATIADRMIGKTSAVPPPSDAFTGSSITSVGDFDKLHVPTEKPIESTTSDSNVPHESSDPEDLALSSGEEDNTPGKEGVSAKDATTAQAPKSPKTATATESETATPDQVGRVSKDTVNTVCEDTQPVPTEAVENGISKQTEVLHENDALPTNSSPPSMNTADHQTSATYAPPVVGSDRIVHSPISPDSRPIPPRTSSSHSPSKHKQTGSKSSEYSQHSKSSSSSSRLLGFTRDQQGRPRPTSSVYAPITDPVGDSQQIRPSSSQAAKDLRRSNSQSRRAPLRIISSSDEDTTAEQVQTKRKSLDQLIQGEETLHYTLTPVSAQFPENALSSQEPDKRRASYDSSQRGYRAGVRRSNQSLTSNSSVGMGGFRPQPSPRTEVPATSSITRAKEAGFILAANKSAPSPSARNKAFHAQPRDAKLEHNTTRDLADYARSTGPTTEEQLAKSLGGRPGTSATMKSFKSLPGAFEAGQAPPMPTDRSATMTSQAFSMKSANRLKFQAREPTVSRQSGTNDLIKFIRDGPQDDLGGVNGAAPPPVRNENYRNSQASSLAPRSVQSSMHSRTALLDSHNRSQTKQVNGVQNGAMPARKQRRARDPYAIDDSDDDLEKYRPLRGKTQEESLIDFLRNTAPTQGMSTPPPILASGSAAPAPEVKRVPSNQGLRGRVMQSVSRNRSGSLLVRKDSVRGTSQANEGSSQYHRNPNAPREVSPHLVQTGKKSDIYRPTTSTHAPHVDRNRKAREPQTGAVGTGTTGIADYLKNSAPPGRGGRNGHEVKEEAGFLRFFSRRKVMKS